LVRSGIQALFSHQLATWHLSRLSKNPVIVTGVASGKTLCYNLPVLDKLLKDDAARALYLFPTKALAQDQLNLLKHYDRELGQPIRPATYDGDTPAGVRPQLRKSARIVISNPDMLHTGILPHHTYWSDFFAHLQFIVIDEIHIYRGVFGSHVANVLRRLKRICQFYGSLPQYILTSATVSNPDELARKLIEEDIQVVGDDGSTQGPRNFIVYNPPLLNATLGIRRSSMQESIRLVEDLLAYDIQSVIFGRSRRSVEIMLTYLHERAPNESSRGYRSGYLPDTRRAIEAGLRSGSTRAVVATNALELGIDIGELSAAVLVGYPGTISATRQQAGRAGRRSEPAVAILVATADPLDQYLARFPEYLTSTPTELALINPNNPLLLLSHIRCAAFELPFRKGDGFGSLPPTELEEYLTFLSNEGVLHVTQDRFFWMADRYPTQEVSLRSTTTNQVILHLQDGSNLTTLGQVDFPSAHWLVHPDAIYLHEGQTYFVKNLDLERQVAELNPVQCEYFTEPRQETSVKLLACLGTAPAKGMTRNYGELQVTTQVSGYRKVRWHTHETIGHGEVSLPPSQLITTGYWLSVAAETVQKLQAMGLWTNSPNDYGPNWGRIRDAVRARDHFSCQVCGVQEQERAHDVHHKTPMRATRDVNGAINLEQANRLDNLITVCQACHRRIETAVRIRSGLSGLSFVLNHLAPLLIMCDRNDLGVHSDPVSPLSNGQPTVVIYDQAPAGIGLSQRVYELHNVLLKRALDLIATCGCLDGCPSCVGPGGELGAGGKLETLAILQQCVDT
jgi:DEAD/DEAH box helicase domain-containing protein